jgi:Leucine-rich repeat (LRR) protein
MSTAALRDLAALLNNLAARPQGKERDDELKELWRRYSSALAAVSDEEEATSPASVGGPAGGDVEDAVDIAGRDAAAAPLPPSLSRQDRMDEWTYAPRPGAYVVQAGRAPRRRASSDDSVSASSSGSANDDAPPAGLDGAAAMAEQGLGRALMAGADGTILVEANLVREEDVTGTLLVEAKPIRRRRQMVITGLVSLAGLAIIVGLSVGLTANRPQPTSAPTTESPTLSPTSQVQGDFRPTLPPYTLDSLRNASSPQYAAYKWATEVDELPWAEAPGNESLRLERMNQRFALATLFLATGGRTSWKNGTGWLNKSTHECSWFGSGCPGYVHENGSFVLQDWRLDSLDLASNDLQQSLPREIGILSSIKALNLEKNVLAGVPPAELGALTLLRALHLNDNLFSGAIPSEIGALAKLYGAFLSRNGFVRSIPTQIGLLTSLTSLEVSDNVLRGTIPAEIGSLLNLYEFGASRNFLSGTVPSVLGKLAKLTSLDLGGNKLEGLPATIGSLAKLIHLDLSSNQLTNLPSAITQLVSLLSLDVSSNFLTSLPSRVGDMARLVTLKLSSNKLTEIPTSIGRLPWLSALDISWNFVSSLPSQLGNVSNLQKLDMSYNTLGGSIPTELGWLSRLTYLDMICGSGRRDDALCHSGEPVGPIPTELGQLTQLVHLDFSVSQINSTVPTQLGLLASLQELFLIKNALTGPIPTELGALSALTDLQLGLNELNATIPEQLGLLSRLQRLEMGYNKVTGPIPTELGQLTALNILDLSNNQLNSTLPTQLGRLTRLGYVSLSVNMLTGNIPTEMGQLSNIIHISLYENRLAGTVPVEVCQLHSNNPEVSIDVDCRELKCDCCPITCARDGRCLNELKALEQCGMMIQGGESCADCLNSNIPDFALPGQRCSALEAYACDGASSCASCAPCVAGTVAFLNCMTAGDCDPITCPGSPPVASPPAPAPSAPACRDEVDFFVQCVRNEGNVDSCSACLNETLRTPSNNTSTCSDRESYFCNAVGACPSCGQCSAEFAVWMTCLDGDWCEINCPGSAPSAPTAPAPSAPPSPPEPCADEVLAINECVVESDGYYLSCTECVKANLQLPPNHMCSDIEPSVCTAVGACPSCGPCAAAFAVWASCLNEGVCDPFNCPGSAPSAPTTPSPPAPPSSSSTPDCDGEESAFNQCFIESQSDALGCVNCYNINFLGNITTCSDLESGACSAISACPICGPCSGELATLASCRDQDLCEPFNCTGSTPGARSGPAPSPPAARDPSPTLKRRGT